jgi:hypothetical protein
MGTQKRFRPTQNLEEVTLASLLGPTPLVAGESLEAFNELRVRFANALRPRDSIEELMVEQVARHAWEVGRWRRSRTAYLSRHLPGHLLSVLRPSFLNSEEKAKLGFDDVETMVAAWARGEPTALERVDSLLADLGLSIGMISDSVPTQDFDTLAVVSQIDRQTATLEARLEDDLEMLYRYRDRRGHPRHEVQSLIESPVSTPQIEDAGSDKAE